MTLKQLEYFVAIAEERQVTAAARRLHISQPPLSHELARLEQELGCELVRRCPRGVELTDAGRLLYERACRILALSSAAAREVSGLGSGMHGTVCLAVAGSAAGLVPTAGLAELAACFPEVSFEVREGGTPQVLELVSSGVAEVGVVRTPFRSQGLRCRYAPAEPLVAVMPPALERGREELSVTLDELRGAPLVCDARTRGAVAAAAGPGTGGAGAAAGAGAAGGEPPLAVVTEDPRTSCAWAAAGMGIALVPRSVLRICDTADSFIKTVAEKDLESRAAVIWKAGRTLSPVAERTVALLGELS